MLPYEVNPARRSVLYSDINYPVIDAIVPLTEMLLEAGADPNSRDSTGRTPLMALMAFLRAHGPWIEEPQAAVNRRLVELLDTHGADFSARDDDGNTALHYLCAGVGGVQRVSVLSAADELGLWAPLARRRGMSIHLSCPPL